MTAAAAVVQPEVEPSPAARPTNPSSVPLPRLDRHFWVAVLLATVVLVGRSVHVARSHSEVLDTSFHLRTGVAFLAGRTDAVVSYLVDPPLGDVLLALPMWLAGADPADPIVADHWPAAAPRPDETEDGPLPPDQARDARAIRRSILFGHVLSPGALQAMTAAWKALLLVPAVACAFQWCRALYGTGAGWLAATLLVGDPTIAAHVPIAALDSLALGAAVVACFAIWRYFERPATWRLAVAAALTAAAMLMKQTAVVVPGVFVALAAVYWVVRPWRDGAGWTDWRADLRPRLTAVVRYGLLVALSIWVLTGFDWSPPARWSHGRVPDGPETRSAVNDVVSSALQRPWPAGVFLGAFTSAVALNAGSFPGYLWDEVRPGGWWYYFPVVATYKMPIGFGVVALLALGSLVPRAGRPRWGEVSLLVPLGLWGAMLLTSGVNVGFRHALIPYAFVLLLSSRCVMTGLGAAWRALAWAGVVAGVGHAALHHPNYLGYLNAPRERWWLHLTDSNFDWGQAAPEVRRWIDAHPEHRGHTIHYHHRWSDAGPLLHYYLGDRVRLVSRGKIPPTDGLLIISPVWVTGVYDAGSNPYEFLRALEPIDTIANAMLVYDLDQLPRATGGGDGRGASSGADDNGGTTRP